MVKKSSQKHDTQSLKKLNEESKELIEIESADKIVSELEALQKDDDTSAAKTRKTETDEPHLHTVEKQNVVKRFGAWFWRKKFLTIPALLIIILGVLLAIPVTRYGMTSWFWKESIVIHVIDDGNNRPVTEATVTVAGQTAKTDARGDVKLTLPVGTQNLSIVKKNYQPKTAEIEVTLFAGGKQYDTEFHATGRVSELVVTNRITGKAIKAALVTITKDDQAKTDDNGKAQIVVPTAKPSIAASVKAEGYIDAQVSIKQGNNELQLLPVGKLYFLSKQRGVLDVVKTNLDGSDRQAVVQGTGHEDGRETNLLASRDWRYLLLKSKREANKPAALYIFDTVKGSFQAVDQENAEWNLIGWSGHNFYYYGDRTDKPFQEGGRQVLKSVNAESRKVTIVDENQSIQIQPNVNYRQSFANFYITDSGVAYTRVWGKIGSYSDAIPAPTDKTADVVLATGSTNNKKILKSYPAQSISYINAKLYEPQEIYFQIVKLEANSKPTYAELENGVYREGVNGDKFDSSEYPTYVMSPSGTQAFWSDSRDGKQTLLLGGKNAENEQELAAKSEYKAYGWFTDDYVLLQKNDSELYISSSAQLKAGVTPLKVSDYHKPATRFPGYGYGYGGQ